ncbi:MAG: hypothetical protein GY820_04700, partial [Gammaproteobacteria bacterium]|nr:hypothetical protein [Gammaproteobacteria bacterium]
MQMKSATVVSGLFESQVESEPADEINVGKVEDANYGKRSAYLLTAQTFIINDEDDEAVPVNARVFLDCGSQKSFIAAKISSQLNLKPVERELLSIHTFGGQKPCTVNSSVVSFKMFLKDGSSMQIQANALKNLTGLMRKGALSTEDQEFLKKVPDQCLAEPISEIEQAFEPDIMIGEDYFWDIIDMSHKQQLPSGMYLLSSKLGLLLGGKYHDDGRCQAYPAMVNTHLAAVPAEIQLKNRKATTDTTTTLEDFWKLESIGIMDSPILNDDDVALEKFNKSVFYKDGRYHVKWPWKADNPPLPDNYGLAFGRFKSLVSRFKGDKELLQKYAAIMEDQCKKGIIEPVPQAAEATESLKHYLPHHPVLTPDKTTTKVRIVYDASAKLNVKSSSLNDCLFRGPIILPDLCGLLLRFRVPRVAIAADIEKAFLQVSLQEEDRDVTRFFWLKDSTRAAVENNVQTYRFCRVMFGVISSPFLLAATLKYHLQNEGSEISQNILDNTYVDNVLTGAETPDEASRMYHSTKEIFKNAAMNLREWASNSTEFLQSIPEFDRTKGGDIVKVLGLIWDIKHDTLKVSDPKALKSGLFTESVTKRQVLNTVASLFDPLGLLSPAILQGKLLLKSLWRRKIGWDSQIPNDLHKEWQELLNSLQMASQFIFPRFIGMEGTGYTHSLVVFVDASAKAYAAVAYLRVENAAGESKTTLLFSKTRLAPEGVSLPRLELMALVIGVRVAHFVKTQLKLQIDSTHIFSDSECVLKWLTSTKPLTIFVSNRLKEIKQQENNNFSYIPSKENPADCASRGMSCAELKNFDLWWLGPKWLTKNKQEWPKWNVPEVTPEILLQVESEEKKAQKNFYETQAMALPSLDRTNIVDVQRYSSQKKLLTSICYMLRFLKAKVWSKLSPSLQEKFSEKLNVKISDLSVTGHPNAKDIEMAKTIAVKLTQKQHFSNVFEDLQTSKRNSLVHQLGIYLASDATLRCHGRIDNADASDDMKFPRLIPSDCHFTTLVVNAAHQRYHHCGTQQTLSVVRQEYWIPKGRSVVHRILRKCVTCQKVKGGPYQLPEMPQLPKERVQRARPFQFTGLDYFGPLWIKTPTDKVKVWVCLFTCLATRAIHLEVAMDLSAVTFLNCLRRFISRRGQPTKIISDNAPQFTLTKG